MPRRPIAHDIEVVRACLGARSIVLVGLMGAGKSSVGRKLGLRLGLRFQDSDHEIETAAGKSIAEIFADHGEAEFREGERRVIRRLLESGPGVLATGGGAFMNAETRAAIAQKGISVWLRADLAILMKRVRKRAARPLLATPDPAATMQALMAERYPIYAEARLTLDTRDAPLSGIVNDVIRALAHEVGTESPEPGEGTSP